MGASCVGEKVISSTVFTIYLRGVGEGWGLRLRARVRVGVRGRAQAYGSSAKSTSQQ